MLTVYLKNGRSAELPNGTRVRLGQLRVGEEADAPLECGLDCYDADGGRVGWFRLEEIAGYALAEESPPVSFFSTTSEQE